MGISNRDVRKFLRKQGMKPSVENVNRMSRELGRTRAENDRMDERGREEQQRKLEQGVRDSGLRDPHLHGSPDTTGPVDPRIRAQVERERKRRERR